MGSLLVKLPLEWGMFRRIFCIQDGQLLIDSLAQVRVYDSVLVEELNYKAILISEETTVEDVIRSFTHPLLKMS